MSKSTYFDVFQTNLLTLSVVVDDHGDVTEIWTRDAGDSLAGRPDCKRKPEAVAQVRRELEEYCNGARTAFDVKLGATGTPFQQKVWDLLVKIPYGETRTYGQLAVELGVPNAARAVGRANATNPIAIIVPCHRVIGSSGALTGYAGGLAAKQALLELEGALKPTTSSAI